MADRRLKLPRSRAIIVQRRRTFLRVAQNRAAKATFESLSQFETHFQTLFHKSAREKNGQRHVQNTRQNQRMAEKQNPDSKIQGLHISFRKFSNIC